MTSIGVIGSGSISEKHVNAVKKINAEIAILRIPSREAIKKEINFFSDCFFNKKPDLMIIASPSIFHQELIEKCRLLNIRALIEKPITNKMPEALPEFNRLKNIQKRDAVVGYCLRFLDSAVQLQELLKTKKFGNLLYVNAFVSHYLPNWRPGVDYKQTVSSKRELGGGVLLELSHEIDYLRWLFGELKLFYSNVRSTGFLNVEVEDFAHLVFSDSMNVPISLTMNFVQKISRRVCDIHFEDAVVHWDIQKNNISLTSSDTVKIIFQGQENAKQVMFEEQLRTFLFYDSPAKIHNLCSIKDALETLKIIEKAKGKIQ